MKINTSGSSITIEGEIFIGQSICISEGQVVVDGVVQTASVVEPINVGLNNDAESVETTGEKS